MSILVAIACYGTRNLAHLNRLLDAYRDMPHDLHLVVTSNEPKDLGSDVEVVVGLPTRNGYSLPFAHKRVFAERAREHDLFIYSEDDTLVSGRNIDAFLAATRVLPNDEIAGFLRYEVAPDGRRHCSSIHSHYHWDPASPRRVGPYTLARLTNPHSACYMLTRAQLERAIDSGGYLVAPYADRFGMLETAATDPYTRCGLNRVICVSHLDEFMLHHLPNIYIGKLGMPQAELDAQLAVIEQMARAGRIGQQLFPTRSGIAEARWSKFYYERGREETLQAVPAHARRVLSIGCGWGDTEARLIAKGAAVVGVPLDEIVAASARLRGVETLAPDMQAGLAAAEQERFEVMLLSDVLQFVRDPEQLLAQFARRLPPGGAIVVSSWNLNHASIWRRRLGGLGQPAPEAEPHEALLSAGKVCGWLARLGLETRAHRPIPANRRGLARAACGLLDDLLARRFVVVGTRAGAAEVGRSSVAAATEAERTLVSVGPE